LGEIETIHLHAQWALPLSFASLVKLITRRVCSTKPE
jgi:hypothetical protein